MRERKEVKEEKEKSARIAAFFDLDGTLIPLPSLERRFFRTLRYRREIPARNYFLWLREALRLLSHGLYAVAHANKMYLRGLPVFNESEAGNPGAFPAHPSGHQARGQASAPPRRNPRLPVPRFFEDALARVAWHAQQGHAIVLVTGTLEPLANAAARELEAELLARGHAEKIQVCATRLEEASGKWTGRILGKATFGEAKAGAIGKLGQEMHLDLSRSFAYGDSSSDKWLLASVGNPAVVNPSRKLARIAKQRGWPGLRWREEKELTPRTPGLQNAQRREAREKPEPANTCVLPKAERCA